MANIAGTLQSYQHNLNSMVCTSHTFVTSISLLYIMIYCISQEIAFYCLKQLYRTSSDRNVRIPSTGNSYLSLHCCVLTLLFKVPTYTLSNFTAKLRLHFFWFIVSKYHPIVSIKLYEICFIVFKLIRK